MIDSYNIVNHNILERIATKAHFLKYLFKKKKKPGAIIKLM